MGKGTVDRMHFDHWVSDEELGALADEYWALSQTERDAKLAASLDRIHAFATANVIPIAQGPSLDAPERSGSGTSTRGTIVPEEDDGETVTGPEVLAMRRTLGRKFEAHDVTGPLRRFADSYRRDYRPTGEWSDDFMRDMANARKLSAGMVKGILNVYCAVNRETVAAAPQEAPSAPQTLPEATEELREGPWFGPDGLPYLVQRGQDSGQLYAKPWDPEAGTRGKFVYEHRAILRVRGGRRMTLDEARAFGQDTGTCGVCGRTLRKRESIEKGIGPVCEAGY